VSRADEIYNYTRTLERESTKLPSNFLGEENSQTILQKQFYNSISALYHLRDHSKTVSFFVTKAILNHFGFEENILIS